MAITLVTNSPSEIISLVTGSPESVFQVPTLDTTPGVFSSTEVTLGVDINGTAATEGVEYNTGPSGYITTTSAQAVGTLVRTYRTTERDTPLVAPWPSSTRVTQTHHKKNNYQWLFLLQEAFDALTGKLGRVLTSLSTLAWDFLGYRGINCGTPLEATDVCTKGYTDVLISNLNTSLRAYVDGLISSLRSYVDTQDAADRSYADNLFSSLATAGAFAVSIYPADVTSGATYIDLAVPLGTFTTGLVIMGATTYNIATDITISDDGSGNMRLTFDAGAVVGDYRAYVLAGTT